jgi:hypothetical protein
MNWMVFRRNYRGIIEILSQYLPAVTEDIMRHFRITSVRAEIRIQHLPNKSKEHYRCTNPFGVFDVRISFAYVLHNMCFKRYLHIRYSAIKCDIRCFQGHEYGDYCVLGFDALLSGRKVP